MSLSGADLRRAASRDEVVTIVAAAADKLAPDDWILGGFWDGALGPPAWQSLMVHCASLWT